MDHTAYGKVVEGGKQDFGESNERRTLLSITERVNFVKCNPHVHHFYKTMPSLHH